MTTTAMPNRNLTAAAYVDTRAIMVLLAVLSLSLGVLAFLPRATAGTTFTQIFVLLIVVIATIDLLSLKVPNLLIYPAIAFSLAGTALVEPSMLIHAAFGAAVLLAVLFLLALLARGGLGMGDVKFGCFLGGGLGWGPALFATVVGLAIGAGIGVLLLLIGLRGRKDSLPLTPFLAAGAVVTTFLAGTLVS